MLASDVHVEDRDWGVGGRLHGAALFLVVAGMVVSGKAWVAVRRERRPAAAVASLAMVNYYLMFCVCRWLREASLVKNLVLL